MNFPRYIRTKAEATALVTDLFPEHRTALARVTTARPGDDYPFYWVENQVRDDLRELFDWLFDDQTRIYKRPRWHLFYDMAKRIVGLISDNRDAVDRHWRMQSAAKEWDRRQRAAHFSDGEGI